MDINAFGANAKKNPFLGSSKLSISQPSNLNPQAYVELFIKNKFSPFVLFVGRITTVLKSSPIMDVFVGTITPIFPKGAA